MRRGGCQCGAVRIELSGTPQRVYACHCLECRRQSASAFGISVIHAPNDLSVVQGEPDVWVRATASGGEMRCWFCPTCGSRLWHEARGVVSVKGGALDEVPEPTRHIWTSRKLPWVRLPEGVQTWPEEPDTD